MTHLLAALLVIVGVQAGSAAQTAPPPDVDPALRAVVERFFATQQAEDVEGYLELWATGGARPGPEQLQFIFESGDDTFTDLAISRATVTDDSARIRVTVTRVRTDIRAKNPDGSPRLFSTRLQLALSLVRQAGEWKILREGAPADELAAALIDTADPAVRRALRESQPDLLNTRLVEAIARRADSRAQKSDFKVAQAIYERGLEVAQAIGDRKAEGQALQNIANALYFQRDFAGALTMYERRLAVERALSNDEGVSNALLGIGTIRYSTYDYGAALQAYSDALEIQERLGDNILIATTLISTGNVLYLQGDYEGAIADYRRAEALKRKFFDLGGAATALEGLGRVYTAQGDFAAALGAFSGVLAERRQRNDIPRQALVLQSIGGIHFRLGNTEQARASFTESRKAFDAVKDAGNAGRVLQGMALNELVAGRFADGEKAYTDSLTLCTGATDHECVARAQVGLAFALAAQQKFDAAITWYNRSLISFNGLRMEDASARARIGLAEALYGKKEFAKALDEAVNARRTAVALASDDLLWRALVSAARAERKLGRPVEALGTARAALAAVERMSVAALERPGQAVPRDTTAVYATTAVLQAEAGDAEAAFVTSERMRAHSLRIALAKHERDIARGMNEAERDEERTLAAELTTLHVKMERQKELPKPDTAVLQKLEAAIAEVSTRRAAFRDALFARLPDLRIWRGLGTPGTAEDLVLLLDSPGTVLLQFVVDEHDVVVLAASRLSSDAAVELSARAVSIERHVLAERIARALDGKALASVEAWRQGSVELFQILPEGITSRLVGATSIIVMPDDLLWRVPFEAAPAGTGFVADHATIVYAASVATAVRAPAAPPTDPARALVAIHSPELPAALVDTLKSTAPTWILRAPEAAAAEIARISLGSPDPPAVVLTGPAATKAGLRAATLPGSATGGVVPLGPLHIAAPFRINSASPLFSSVLLAEAPKPAETATTGSGQLEATSAADATPAPVAKVTPVESELEARELFNLDPLAHVVTFSDPAALSKRDAAAAVVPVHWAWRAAGATTVILKRWGGDDLTAREIMGRFYEALRTGASPVDALHAARAAVRATESGRAPAAWAGWLLVR